MKQLKANRAKLSDVLVRAKTRLMSLTTEKETGIEIKNAKGETLGIAFPDSELALKYLSAILSVAKLDGDLAALQASLEDRERAQSGIVRPPGPMSVS